MATRNERVILSLQDDLTGGMARAAAATRLLSGELDRLDGRSTALSKSVRPLSAPNGDLSNLGRVADKSGPQIDRLSGRLSILAETAAVLGPSLIPIGAVAVPAIAGLANQLGVAALAGGTAILAFQGVGDALKAVNAAQIEPTAENLAKAREQLELLSPAAQHLVKQLDRLGDGVAGLRDVAATGLLPGLSAGLDDLERRTPEVTRIVANVSATLGNLLAEAGDNLASAEWTDFFDFLATDATRTLASLGRSVGNLTRGFADLWMAFAPFSDDFSSFLLTSSRDFASWAAGLDQTEGFQDFLAYVRETGPQVADTLGSLANALLQIVEAGAPLGGPVLQALEAVAKTVAAIADSPIGTPLLTAIAAMSLLNRTTAAYEGVAGSAFGKKAQASLMGTVTALTKVTSAQERATLSVGKMARAEQERRVTLAKSAAAVAGVGLLASGAADGLGLANTASLALTGAFLGGGAGAVAGGLVGAVMDVSKALDISDASMRQYIETTLAASGPDLGSQIAGVSDEIAKQQKIIDGALFSTGKFLGTGLNSSEGAQHARDRMDELRKTLAELEHQRDLDSIAADREGTVTARAGEAAQRAAVRHQALAKAARTTAERFVGLGDSLNDSKVSLGDWIADMEKSARQLRNFRLNAQAAAEKGLRQGLIKALQEAGPEGAARMEQLANATDRQIRRANRAWLAGRTEVRKYANAASEVPTDISTTVHVYGVSAALIQTNQLAHALLNLPTHAPVGVLAPRGQANGGTVMGPRLPYADKVPTLLAPGEEVISNRHGQADRNRSLLRAINANRYADGGTVAAMRAQLGGSRYPAAPALPASANSVSAGYSRIHPDDMAALARLTEAGVERGSARGTAQGHTDQARISNAARRVR